MKSKRIVRGRYQTTSKKWTSTKPNIEIVYEDNHLLIIDKPTGLLSQADKTNHVDVTYLCKRYLKKEYNKRYGKEQMNTYFVDVKVVGHWYERYEVEADSMADAKDNWHDGEFIESYEHCGNERDVVEVKQV